MDRFIEITYESYNRTIADEFDRTVPSIFTDEPQFSHKGTLKFAKDCEDVTLPWTDDLADTFRAAYGEDLIAGIPELIWELPDGKVSVIRYHYHDHICERFTEAFADNCGKWCRDHHLKLTGHMMEEPTLRIADRRPGRGHALVSRVRAARHRHAVRRALSTPRAKQTQSRRAPVRLRGHDQRAVRRDQLGLRLPQATSCTATGRRRWA